MGISCGRVSLILLVYFPACVPQGEGLEPLGQMVTCRSHGLCGKTFDITSSSFFEIPQGHSWRLARTLRAPDSTLWIVESDIHKAKPLMNSQSVPAPFLLPLSGAK